MDFTEDELRSHAQWPAPASPMSRTQPPEDTPLQQPLGGGQHSPMLLGGYVEQSSPAMNFSPQLGWDNSPLAYRQVHAPNLLQQATPFGLFHDSPTPLGAPFKPRPCATNPGLGWAGMNDSPLPCRLSTAWNQATQENHSTVPFGEATPYNDYLGTSTIPDQLGGTPFVPEAFSGAEGIAGHSTLPPPDDNVPSTPCAPAQRQEQTFEEKMRTFSQPQNNRIRKPRISGQGLDPHETILAEQSALPQTRRFPGFFANADAANRAMNDLQNAWRMPKTDYTTPADDASFPATDADMVAVVANVFDAISDWSHVTEWKNTLPRDERARITEKLVARSSGGLDVYHSNTEGLRPTDPELANLLPSLEVQQKKILGQVPSDQAIECISWGIVQAAIKSQQGFTQIPYWCEQDGTSKQLVKSLLTAGDGWKLRIVNAPTKEFQAKAKNRRVNAKRPGLQGNVGGGSASAEG
ncbi:hypothetical protein CP533_6649 [Ophiocordyceps camponoti-saundersi (nom. inval.)]|nr:hypothetical protein CP533_6649 [Ophiocordyceps camponoti-saundersi (nom. inval.)]